MVDFIRSAVTENDVETAKHIQGVLREVCSSGKADGLRPGSLRVRVWGQLTASEQVTFAELVKSRAPVPQPDDCSVSEARPFGKLRASPYGGCANGKEGVTDADANLFRDIALTWWDEFYPEQIQSLISQISGWNAPGTRYSPEAINQWLETENEKVRDRITELLNKRK